MLYKKNNFKYQNLSTNENKRSVAKMDQMPKCQNCDDHSNNFTMKMATNMKYLLVTRYCH